VNALRPNIYQLLLLPCYGLLLQLLLLLLLLLD
jgi:hypothetical protein